MQPAIPHDPPWLVTRLGDDLNWWIAQTGDEEPASPGNRGLLDPRQLAHLLEALNQYRSIGFRRQLLTEAFQFFVVAAEVTEGALRLAATDEDVFGGGEFFARPRLTEDGEGPYADFFDALTAARIRLLNKTHHFAQPCTEEEMIEELSALDTDRYLSAEAMHVFDEINEILEWSPAEWDNSSS